MCCSICGRLAASSSLSSCGPVTTAADICTEFGGVLGFYPYTLRVLCIFVRGGEIGFSVVCIFVLVRLAIVLRSVFVNDVLISLGWHSPEAAHGPGFWM